MYLEDVVDPVFLYYNCNYRIQNKKCHTKKNIEKTYATKSCYVLFSKAHGRAEKYLRVTVLFDEINLISIVVILGMY